jgi:hypothetical protein
MYPQKVDHFDPNKYLQTFREKGYSAALTELHHDMAALEEECFESPEGYRPELYEEMNKFRDFSRKLWQHHLEKGSDQAN